MMESRRMERFCWFYVFIELRKSVDFVSRNTATTPDGNAGWLVVNLKILPVLQAGRSKYRRNGALQTQSHAQSESRASMQASLIFVSSWMYWPVKEVNLQMSEIVSINIDSKEHYEKIFILLCVTVLGKKFHSFRCLRFAKA
jgi:hypothetical protein